MPAIGTRISMMSTEDFVSVLPGSAWISYDFCVILSHLLGLCLNVVFSRANSRGNILGELSHFTCRYREQNTWLCSLTWRASSLWVQSIKALLVALLPWLGANMIPLQDHPEAGLLLCPILLFYLHIFMPVLVLLLISFEGDLWKHITSTGILSSVSAFRMMAPSWDQYRHRLFLKVSQPA